MCVCMAIGTSSPSEFKTIDLIFHKKYYTLGSVLLYDDPDRDPKESI